MMNVAEWIIVSILSGTLFVFLIVGIVLIVKLIKLTNSAKTVVEKWEEVTDKAKDIVDKADDMADSVVSRARNLTSFAGIAKTFAKGYNKIRRSKKSKKGLDYDD